MILRAILDNTPCARYIHVAVSDGSGTLKAKQEVTMVWTRRLRLGIVAGCFAAILLMAVSGAAMAAPHHNLGQGPDTPYYIECSIQNALTIQNASVPDGSGYLYVYLYRMRDSHTLQTCGWEAYAAGPSGHTIQATLWWACTGNPPTGIQYSTGTGTGSATSGEDSDSTQAPFFASGVDGSTSVATHCGQ